MRALLAALLLTPCLALADAAPTVDASVPSSAVAPASALDAERLFNTTEAYHLEPSDVRVELRYLPSTSYTEGAVEVRTEVGLTRHFQLDLAQDITQSPGHSPQPSATPIGVRYSLGTMEDELLFNPAVEVTLIPRANAPARAALRLLLAEELVPHLVVAANGYVEQSLQRDTHAGVDGTFGMTSGLSYTFLSDHLHVGAEGQIGGAQYGAPGYSLVLAAGPNAAFSAGPCSATLTSLFNLEPVRVGFEPMATVGCTF